MEVSKLNPIKDKVDLSNQGIILISGKTMEEIYKKSGPLASSNEFQVHYWFLNLRFRAEDNSILDIAIPTTYFNYPQEVTSVHIDFELKDVVEMSKTVEPIHNMKVNELQETDIIPNIEKLFGVQFESMSEHSSSIHKHPGGSKSQNFSTTDLKKSAKEPGVVFPIQEASEDMPSFAGIMALDSGVCNVAHYEYRTVNGKLGEDITYKQGRCLALVTREVKKVSVVEKLLGIRQEEAYYVKAKNVHEISEYRELIHLFKSIAFNPSTDCIDPQNITKPASRTLLGDTVLGKALSAVFPTKDKSTQDLIDNDAATLKRYDGFIPKTPTELNNMSDTLLLEYYIYLNKLYFGEDCVEVTFESTEEMLEEVTALQVDIGEELLDLQQKAALNTITVPKKETLEQKREILVGYGMSRTLVHSADAARIDAWLKRARGEF